jgi:protein TonB
MNIKSRDMADTMYQPYSRPEQPRKIAGGFILSICIHIVLLLQLSQMHLSDAEAPHQMTFVEVELVHMATAQEVVQEDIKSEQPEPEQDIQQEEAAVEQEKPKPIKQKAPQPKIVKKVVKKNRKPHVVKKVTHTAELVTSSHAPINAAVIKQSTAASQKQLKQARQQYLSRIMSMIKAHKSYPYSARRRHIEGDIQVSFLIDSKGNTRDLHITGGSSALRSATRQAIEDAQPFPQPPQQSIRSQFIMQYQLK